MKKRWVLDVIVVGLIAIFLTSCEEANPDVLVNNTDQVAKDYAQINDSYINLAQGYYLSKMWETDKTGRFHSIFFLQEGLTLDEATSIITGEGYVIGFTIITSEQSINNIVGDFSTSAKPWPDDSDAQTVANNTHNQLYMVKVEGNVVMDEEYMWSSNLNLATIEKQGEIYSINVESHEANGNVNLVGELNNGDVVIKYEASMVELKNELPF